MDNTGLGRLVGLTALIVLIMDPINLYCYSPNLHGSIDPLLILLVLLIILRVPGGSMMVFVVYCMGVDSRGPAQHVLEVNFFYDNAFLY